MPSMIDRYHLRYFLGVVDSGNFSRAAAACNVSQPTLSVGIAKLEKALGQPLFDRSNRRVALTPAGARLLGYARSIEAGFAGAEQAVAASGSVPMLRLGLLVTTPPRWIEAALATMDGDLRLEIVEGRDRELRERLARGRIDIALLALRDDDAPAMTRPLRSEGYALALPAAHRLAGRVQIRAEELIDDPMIVRRHCELLGETSRFFTARGIRPPFPARTTSDERALGYVRAGMGVTVMPDAFRAPGVTRVPLEGFTHRRTLGLLTGPHTDPATPRIGMLGSALAHALDDDR